MNNARRKVLKNIVDVIEDQVELLTSAHDDEEEYLDNIPENLQESQRYFDTEENVSDLESATESLNEAIEYIQSAIDR